MDFSVTITDDDFGLEAHVRFVGEDLLVAVWGGDRPHIGAVAVAQPRPSLRPPHDEISASTSVICLLGHKEDVFARSAAESLAAALNRPVVVSAGMHWDQISCDGIARVEDNARQLVVKIMQELSSRKIISTREMKG